MTLSSKATDPDKTDLTKQNRPPKLAHLPDPMYAAELRRNLIQVPKHTFRSFARMQARLGPLQASGADPETYVTAVLESLQMLEAAIGRDQRAFLERCIESVDGEAPLMTAKKAAGLVKGVVSEATISRWKKLDRDGSGEPKDFYESRYERTDDTRPDWHANTYPHRPTDHDSQARRGA